MIFHVSFKDITGPAVFEGGQGKRPLRLPHLQTNSNRKAKRQSKHAVHLKRVLLGAHLTGSPGHHSKELFTKKAKHKKNARPQSITYKRGMQHQTRSCLRVRPMLVHVATRHLCAHECSVPYVCFCMPFCVTLPCCKFLSGSVNASLCAPDVCASFCARVLCASSLR